MTADIPWGRRRKAKEKSTYDPSTNGSYVLFFYRDSLDGRNETGLPLSSNPVSKQGSKMPVASYA